VAASNPPLISVDAAQKSRLEIRGNPDLQFARKSAPDAQFPAKSHRRASGIFYCKSNASEYFTGRPLIGSFARSMRQRLGAPRKTSRSGFLLGVGIVPPRYIGLATA